MMLQGLLLMYLQNLRILSTGTIAPRSLLLMYLQNLRILSMSTFAYTARAETRA